MDMSGCGQILAALISEAVQSYLRPLIPCIDGMEMPGYAMCTSTTFIAPPFLQRETEKSTRYQMAGQSGSRMGGLYRR